MVNSRGEDVVQTLERVCAGTGYPKMIRVDNGSEFVSRDLDLWAYANDVTLDFSIRSAGPLLHLGNDPDHGPYRLTDDGAPVAFCIMKAREAGSPDPRGLQIAGLKSVRAVHSQGQRPRHHRQTAVSAASDDPVYRTEAFPPGMWETLHQMNIVRPWTGHARRTVNVG